LSLSPSLSFHVTHVARATGTYGTNIELSAFVARYRRPVKIWQPNLIYVMPVEESPAESGSSSGSAPESSAKAEKKGVSPRERRALARAEREKEKERTAAGSSKAGKGKQPVREEHAEDDDGQAGDQDVPLCIV
jgi:hypothetical protein